MLTNLIIVKAKRDMSNSLRRYLLGLEDKVRDEAGCLIWDLNQSVSDPLIWVIYEAWENEDALFLHSCQPHMLKLVQDLPDLLDKYWDIDSFRMVGHFPKSLEFLTKKNCGFSLAYRMELAKHLAELARR